MQRLIREEEAPRPSTRLSSLGVSATTLAGNRGLDVRRLVQLLAGDLDWLVMKALEKDRNRRYDTPGSFAEDIERYLHDEAILARPPSMPYKVKKFAQRNRATVITTATIAASLILGIVLTSWQAVRALAAEERATRAQAQAEIDRDRARDAERRTSDSLQQFVQEQKRAEKAKAETKAAQSKANDLLKQWIAMDSLFRAMNSEQQGSYETAEAAYRWGLEYAQKELGFERLPTYYATVALAGFYNRRNTPEKAEEPVRKFYHYYKLRHDQRAMSDEEVVDPKQFDEAYVRASTYSVKTCSSSTNGRMRKPFFAKTWLSGKRLESCPRTSQPTLGRCSAPVWSARKGLPRPNHSSGEATTG